MKKTFLILAVGLLLTGCMKTVEFTSYANDGKYSATYDTAIWTENESHNLQLKSDDACYINFDGGGKDAMGEYTYEDGENGAIVRKEKVNGVDVIVDITKKIGDPANPTLVIVVPATSDNPEECVKAGYAVVNSVK